MTGVAPGRRVRAFGIIVAGRGDLPQAEAADVFGSENTSHSRVEKVR